MEQKIAIPTLDWYEIPWLLNWEQDTNKCIVFFHGLTGSMSEAHYYEAKEYFVEKGFAVLRFNLYSGWDTTRELHESTIRDHGIDTEKVLEYASSRYSSLYLIGHSLGGPSIVNVTTFPNALKKIIFWDPAFDTNKTTLRCFEKNGIWFFYPRNGKNIELFKGMYDELVANNHLEKLEQLNFPKEDLDVIFAEEASHKDTQQKIESLGISSTIISWANHWFTQEGKYKELFDMTFDCINK